MEKKLKILICTQEYPPIGSGIAFVVFNVVKHLRRRDIKVIICSPIGPGIKLGNKSLIEKTGGFGLLHFWNKVGILINKNWKKYDFIWCHNPLFLRKIKAKNLINTTHTTYMERINTLGGLYTPNPIKTHNYLMRYFEKFSYQKMKYFDFTVTSTQTKEELIKLGVKGNINIIPNGSDLKPFQSNFKKKELREQLKVPTKAKVLLTVGRMMPQKNHLQLIKIFSEIKKLDDDVHLIIIGGGPLKGKIISLIKERKIKNIRVIDKVDQKILLKFYLASDFFITPSSYEGQPLALMESLSCGLIPILSKIPIFYKLVDETGIGLLTDFKEGEEKEIFNFIKNSNIKKESKEISEYFINNYSWSIITERYIRLFNKKFIKDKKDK